MTITGTNGRGRLLVCCALCLILAPRPTGAQERPAPVGGATLSARMHEFLEAATGRHEGSVAAYFPRRGDWTWYHTVHRDGVPDRVQVWRFPAAAMADALQACGPAGDSFVFRPEGQPPGVVSEALEHGTRWRRVGAARFVPPDASARSPVFVEWRREDGAWVVSAFGDESFRGSRPPSGEVRPAEGRTVQRDTTGPMPASEAFAAGEPWYQNNEVISFQDLRYLKYGNPRPITRERLAWIGVLGAIRVYAEQRAARWPEVIYLPVAPGSYQMYQTFNAPRCQ